MQDPEKVAKNRHLVFSTLPVFLEATVNCAVCSAIFDFITFRVSHRRREMYNGHARLSGWLCVDVCDRMPTLLHEPGCKFVEW